MNGESESMEEEGVKSGKGGGKPMPSIPPQPWQMFSTLIGGKLPEVLLPSFAIHLGVTSLGHIKGGIALSIYMYCRTA